MDDQYEMDDHYDTRDGHVVCPRCMGGGEVDCNCGGDLCVCENYGDADCPTCGGTGDVTVEREAIYLQRQREFFEIMTKAREAANG